MSNDATPTSLWIEVANVRLKTADPTTIDVQLKGDQDHHWWPTKSKADAFKSLMDAMEKKRPVHAELVAADGKLSVNELSMMFVEPQR